MAGGIYGSTLYGRLFPTGEIGALFSDRAEIRAMLLVEGALARVQGGLGVIPADSASVIDRAAREAALDPGALAGPTAANGVPVPGLVAAFRAAIADADHGTYAHWGATSQDIADTGLMLRLRRALILIEADLDAALAPLADLAEAHASTPMPARTYGQHATPTSFGAVVAAWGAPVLALLDDLPRLRAEALVVSLSGAAGTAAALGSQADAIRAGLAATLDLADPGRSWHTDRTPVLRIADWMTRLSLALGKIGEDVTALGQTGLQEVALTEAGASSTMPQKRNPVIAATLAAAGRVAPGLNSAVQAAAMHQHQRDGGAMFGEWLALPSVVLTAAAAAANAATLARGLRPDPDRMGTALADGLSLTEALSFALARQMPRAEAKAEASRLAVRAVATGTSLAAVARSDYPALDPALFDPARQLGTAPKAAQSFAAAVRDRMTASADPDTTPDA
jgi:3-carboxy-cis,cis-muconate cycloisomerase